MNRAGSLLTAAIVAVIVLAAVPIWPGLLVWPALVDDESSTPDPRPAPIELPDELENARDLQACATPGIELDDSSFDPSAAKREQVQQIADQVEQIRQLRFKQTVDAEFLAPEAVAGRIGRLSRRGYPKRIAALDERVLRALRVMKGPEDLREMLIELNQSQVVGFYVPKTEELVVRTSDIGRLGPLDRVTLAHELEHALADQSFDLKIPERAAPKRSERDLAYLALVEGDATLTMQQFATGTLGLADQLAISSDPSIASSAQDLERVPYFIQQQLLFPYIEGLKFVCYLYRQGGWSAVDRAYKNPPITTAEVLSPTLYGHGIRPRDPTDPDSPGPGWKRGYVTGFGAAHFQWLMDAPGGDPSRDVGSLSSAHWKGGELHLWIKGKKTALAVVLAVEPTDRLVCLTLADWYRAAWPAGIEQRERTLKDVLAIDSFVQTAVIRCTPGEVTLGIAPDLATARRLTR